MIAPVRVTPDLFNALVDKWYEENAYNRGIIHKPSCGVERTAFGGDCTCGAMIRYECKKCGSPIKLRLSYLSVHFGAWTDHCVGAGEVVKPHLPYCPKCSPDDEVFGCIHLVGETIPTVIPNKVSPKERLEERPKKAKKTPETRFKQLLWTLGIVAMAAALYALFH